MEIYLDRIKKAARFLKARGVAEASAGLVLGSGLGAVAEELEVRFRVPYSAIPGFPAAVAASAGPVHAHPRMHGQAGESEHMRVEGHAYELLSGSLGGKSAVIFSGRFHYYQGYNLQEVTLPVRVLKELGAKTIIVTNASGGINRSFKPGDIMLIRDHINLMGSNPLIGLDPALFGSPFIDMSEPYERELLFGTKRCAAENRDIGKLQEGVYLAVSGPSYETASEIAFFEKIGADAVGMSTVPEVIAAVHEGMRVIGISVISNKACGIAGQKLSHSDVLEEIKRAGGRVRLLIRDIMQKVL